MNGRQNCHTPPTATESGFDLGPGPACSCVGQARACAGSVRERGQSKSTADHITVLSFETQRADWIKASCSLSRNERSDHYYEFQH